jgi:leucyl aminopeptidase (aminopeptidase T)
MMKGVDVITVSDELKRIVKKVVDKALPVQEGQVVTTFAGMQNLDIAYAFAAECAARGVETLVSSEPDEVAYARFTKAPLSYFKRTPRLVPELIKASDWVIYMGGSRHDSTPFYDPAFKERQIEIQRVSTWSIDNVLNLCLDTGTHVVAFLDPNLQQAQQLDLSYEETKRQFLESLDIDYQALSELGEKLIAKMSGAGEIRLTSPKGTDMTISPGKRPWKNDDGSTPSPEGFTPYIHNLPVGEVFVAPLEDSAEGVLLPENFPGYPIKDLKIEFHGAQPATVSASEGFEFIQPRLEKATGNPYCIAEFALGTNPCADPLLATEKAYATAHVAIGQNTWLGGVNECSLHMDVLVDKPTVVVDGECIMRDGEFNF